MKTRRKKLQRSLAGNIAIFSFLGIMAVFMALPLVYTISNAVKPLNEIWEFPPHLFVRNPTFENFYDLVGIFDDSWIPFGRYVLNTLAVTAAGTGLHILVASMAAYPLAKGDFPGRGFINSIIVLSLMFAGNVTAVPAYLIMSRLGLVDSLWAVILPAVCSSLGLFLMRQYMEGVPTSLIEAAKIDGSNEFTTLFRIVMPTVKPAWLTLILFSFQALWGNNGGTYIYSEQRKLLPYALNQIILGGVARTGASYAATFLMLLVPIMIFLITQSNVIETMSSSGLKD